MYCTQKISYKYKRVEYRLEIASVTLKKRSIKSQNEIETAITTLHTTD